jgi:hypothetical protein
MPECLDRPNPVGWEAMGTSPRLRGAIEQLAIAVAVALEPLGCRALATACGLGRLYERPASLEHPLTDEPAAARTGPMVSVESHPVTSLGLRLLTPPASKEARMNNVLRNYS